MEVTLLKLEQVYGVDKTFYGEGRLEIFKKYGMTAAVTDFSILLGNTTSLYTNSDGSLGRYWLNSFKSNFPYTIDVNGGRYTVDCIYRHIGIRPVISFSELKANYPYNIIKKEDNVLEIEFGYYPQTAISKDMQEELGLALLKRKIFETGNTYTTDSHMYNEYDAIFNPIKRVEYEYNGKRYVLTRAMTYYDDSKFELSNKVFYKNDDFVWIEVEPLKWIVDLKTDIMTTKQIIISGIQFDRKKQYSGDFEYTDIYKYLNTYFIKDITQNIYNELEVKVEYEKTNREVELENIEKAKQKILAFKNKIK